MNRYKIKHTIGKNRKWLILICFIVMQLIFLLNIAIAQESSKSQTITTGTGKKSEGTSPTTPSLSSLLRQSVVFIYEDKTPADSSEVVPGAVLGTGFIVGIPLTGHHEKSFPFIVTAKHVVAEHSKILVRLTLKSGREPGFAPYNLDELRRNEDVWEYPNDEGVDILVFRTPWFEAASIMVFPIELIASKEVFTKENIDISDRVMIPCMMGDYPGSAQNYPIFRDGTIALITEEKVPIKWRLGNKIIPTSQELIFVNSVVNEGFSGAPVFLWPGFRSTPKGATIGGKPWLIGIGHGFFPQLRSVVDADLDDMIFEKRDPRVLFQTRQVKMYSQNNPGTGIIFPSWHLLDILQNGDFKKRIDKLTNEEIGKEKAK